MSKKLKEKKKKKREEESRAKVLRRREFMRKQAKYERELDKDVKNSREKIVPAINPHKEKERKRLALERNMEILASLEKAYKEEQERRVKLNEKLELEGCHTMAEKMVKLSEDAAKIVGHESLIEKTKKILESKLDVEVAAGQLLNS